MPSYPWLKGFRHEVKWSPFSLQKTPLWLPWLSHRNTIQMLFLRSATKAVGHKFFEDWRKMSAVLLCALVSLNSVNVVKNGVLQCFVFKNNFKIGVSYFGYHKPSQTNGICSDRTSHNRPQPDRVWQVFCHHPNDPNDRPRGGIVLFHDDIYSLHGAWHIGVGEICWWPV